MIGAHTVTVVPDPTTIPWSAPLADNFGFSANLAGWAGPPYGAAGDWVWGAPGLAKWVAGPSRFGRAESAPVARPPTILDYRVRVRGTVTVPAAMSPLWIIPTLVYGQTAHSAWTGSFWDAATAIEHTSWLLVPTGTTAFDFTLDSDARQVAPSFAFLGPTVQAYSRVATVAGYVLSVDSIELTGQTYDPIDITCLVDSVAIQHGRDTPSGQPDASTATLELSYDSGLDALPSGLDVGSLVTVSTIVGGTVCTRFGGRVTDMNTGWDDAGEDTPNAVVAQVMAAGPLADAGRRIVGDEPWPQELDGARVARLMRLAGFQLDAITSDPGVAQILPMDVDKQAALELAQAVATSAMGILWQTKDGAIRYADSEHRRNTAAGITLDACDVLVTPTWRRDTEGLINTISLGYGPTPDEGEQPRYETSDAGSQTRYGRYEYTVATVLADLANAQALGQLLMARNRVPVWILSELPVDVRGLTTADTIALLSLDMHALVEVSGLPVTGALPSNTSLWVEGWSETLTHGGHDLSLYVSGYCRTAPPPRWDDVPNVWTWDTLPNPAATWNDATCFGPPTTTGRWSDVPASARWDYVAPTVTWNTWTY